MPYKDPKKQRAAEKRSRTKTIPCVHGKRKDSCKICRPCPHGKLKSACKDCGGSQICSHGHFKRVCRVCRLLGIGGASLCGHGRVNCTICQPEKAYYACQKDATRRGLTFTLTKDEFIALIKYNCRYCNRTPEECGGMGIDRVDNGRGYALDNCAPCCCIDNRAKRTSTAKEYLEQCRRVTENALRKEIYAAG
jgi:hypothetical protein